MEPIQELNRLDTRIAPIVDKINELITRVNYLTGFAQGMSDRLDGMQTQLDQSEPSQIRVP